MDSARDGVELRQRRDSEGGHADPSAQEGTFMESSNLVGEGNVPASSGEPRAAGLARCGGLSCDITQGGAPGLSALLPGA